MLLIVKVMLLTSFAVSIPIGKHARTKHSNIPEHRRNANVRRAKNEYELHMNLRSDDNYNAMNYNDNEEAYPILYEDVMDPLLADNNDDRNEEDIAFSKKRRSLRVQSRDAASRVTLHRDDVTTSRDTSADEEVREYTKSDKDYRDDFLDGGNGKGSRNHDNHDDHRTVTHTSNRSNRVTEAPPLEVGESLLSDTYDDNDYEKAREREGTRNNETLPTKNNDYDYNYVDNNGGDVTHTTSPSSTQQPESSTSKSRSSIEVTGQTVVLRSSNTSSPAAMRVGRLQRKENRSTVDPSRNETNSAPETTTPENEVGPVMLDGVYPSSLNVNLDSAALTDNKVISFSRANINDEIDDTLDDSNVKDAPSRRDEDFTEIEATPDAKSLSFADEAREQGEYADVGGSIYPRDEYRK